MSHVSIKPFLDATEKRSERLQAIADSRKKVIGYFCTYTPIELIHAAGFLPVRLFGGIDRVEFADSLTPNFICPYMRLAIERGLKGEYDYLSGLIQGYTCDVACGMINIWEENIKKELYHTIPLPYNDNLEGREFFRSALNELSQKLGEIGGEVSDESLESSLELYGEIRGLVLKLYDMRYDRLFPLKAQDFYAIIQAGFVTPPEEFKGMLGTLLEEIGEGETLDSGGTPVLVSGSLIEEPLLFRLIVESGGDVVADDLCTGFRHFAPIGGAGDRPIERLIDRYMKRFPCPSRTRAIERLPLLYELIERSGAKGVIFLFQKFCTPHLADHPIINDMLKKKDIPTILIEMEETGIMEGQVRTRLEGFFEMIGS